MDGRTDEGMWFDLDGEKCMASQLIRRANTSQLLLMWESQEITGRLHIHLKSRMRLHEGVGIPATNWWISGNYGLSESMT